MSFQLYIHTYIKALIKKVYVACPPLSKISPEEMRRSFLSALVHKSQGQCVTCVLPFSRVRKFMKERWRDLFSVSRSKAYEYTAHVRNSIKDAVISKHRSEAFMSPLFFPNLRQEIATFPRRLSPNTGGSGSYAPYSYCH